MTYPIDQLPLDELLAVALQHEAIDAYRWQGSTVVLTMEEDEYAFRPETATVFLRSVLRCYHVPGLHALELQRAA